MTIQKPYPAYRETGLPWLGQIPAHWEAKRLKLVAPASRRKLTDKPDDLPYVGLENIESGSGRLLMHAQPETVESNVGVFAKGDILFGKLRPYLAKVAEAAFDGCCTTEILALVAKKVSGRYLFYSLLSPGFIKFVSAITYGTKMPRASWEQIGSLVMSIPPLPEQRAIAAYLDLQTDKIDALIAKKQQLLELLAEQRAALISQAVTKGLNQDVEIRDPGAAWLGHVPEHWKVTPLKYLVRFINGAPFKPSEWGAEGTPIIRIENLNGGDEFNFTTRVLEARYHVRKGDLLFGWSGNRGTSFGPFIWPKDGPYYLNQHIFRLDEFDIIKEYFYWLLKGVTYYVEQQAHGIIGLVHITKEDLGKIPVPIPPSHEQALIVSFIDRQVNTSDQLVSSTQSVIDRLREFRGALISAAVTGRIKVPDA